jgi:hypothetical protein
VPLLSLLRVARPPSCTSSRAPLLLMENVDCLISYMY